MWKKRFHNRRPAGALKPPQTRLQRASMLQATFPRPRQALGKRLTAAVSVTNNRNKKEAAKEFQQWQKDLPDTHLVAFSDGSQDEKGAVGWGYAIYRDGHEDIEGNEEADRLAKEGTKMLMGNPNISATYAAAKRKIRETRDRHFRDWWQEALPRHRSYHALDLKTATLKCHRELSLPRGTLHHLLACRKVRSFPRDDKILRKDMSKRKDNPDTVKNERVPAKDEPTHGNPGTG
ncbi:uncharacterized protein FPOAC1_013123 [Fusarium poae]|uniref:uncharacterized protein n=1 Tax=Fusarium poae TaxID=36050 RepID=UPI001D0422CC|nr:uncharacterized protein FPOAC1_013123 [Fusarium poae]KAG8665145.1 hypothetical protein FPOAC1_013123 [Fusarium poae]